MIAFMIPAYNEAANLPELLSSLEWWAKSRREDCRLIVVDDGSTDGTAEIVNEFKGLPVTLVRHQPNLGVARVFQSGFRAWSGLPSGPQDLLVSLEADNTSSLEILDAMIEQARNGCDVVLASCYSPGGEVVGTNLLRTALSFCANLLLRSTPGMPNVNTFSSFYRVYRAPFVNRAVAAYGARLIEEQGFVCVVEMLLKFGRMGALIGEVPLRLDGGRRKGPSKMKVMRTIRGYLYLFLRASTGRVARPDAEAAAPETILAGKSAFSGQ
jgi:dolichol-phosphate mannosyltransferase